MSENTVSDEGKQPERQPIPCTTKPVDGPWDTIVIGSGISGLALAATLSRTGDRVLVLERHFQVGGFTHVFRRGAYEWDVGIHYLGAVGPLNDWSYQLAALTGGRVRFEPFGGTVDRIRFPGLTVDMPGSYAAYKAVLAEAFPAERDGMSAYLDKIADTRARLRNYFASNVVPRPLSWLARRTLVRVAHEAATVTTDEMMARYLKDERLKDVLDAQWGNIGMPRPRCSFLVHAAMLGFYLEADACYPVGGASVFARELGRAIHDSGSAIRVRADVERILTSGDRAIGVRLAGGEEILAKRVVSSVGVNNTYGRLLADHPAVRDIRQRIRALPLAYEYMNLFLGLDCSPAELGIGKENHWIYGSWRTGEDVFWDLDRASPDHPPKILFFGSSAMRDPEHGRHGNTGYNAQVVLIGKQGHFDRWKGTEWRRRGADYEAIKARVAQALVGALDRHFPGLAGHVAVSEVSTPPTYVTFSGHHEGIPYGVAPIPARYASFDLRPQTPIGNLFLCGQDMVLPGVTAAFGSAMMCCAWIRRRDVGRALRRQGEKMV